MPAVLMARLYTVAKQLDCWTIPRRCRGGTSGSTLRTTRPAMLHWAASSAALSTSATILVLWRTAGDWGVRAVGFTIAFKRSGAGFRSRREEEKLRLGSHLHHVRWSFRLWRWVASLRARISVHCEI